MNLFFPYNFYVTLIYVIYGKIMPTKIKIKHSKKYGTMHFPDSLAYYHREYFPLYYRIYYLEK